MTQCKDIPDRPILELLARNPKQWHTWHWREWDVSSAMPPGTPAKLVLAKMRKLIRRGVVAGCACGCRGDFVITEAGLAELRGYPDDTAGSRIAREAREETNALPPAEREASRLLALQIASF